MNEYVVINYQKKIFFFRYKAKRRLTLIMIFLQVDIYSPVCSYTDRNIKNLSHVFFD
jgi:hypothetical protein